MKTRAMFVAICGLFVFAAAGQAFGPGGAIPSSGTKAEAVTKTVAKGAIEAGINDNLKKKNCAFSDAKTENQTTCNLDQIISELKNWRDGLDNTIANDVDIHIEASAADSDLAWKRVSYVQDKLKAKISYWDWYTDKTTANGDKLKIWVKVH